MAKFRLEDKNIDLVKGLKNNKNIIQNNMKYK